MQVEHIQVLSLERQWFKNDTSLKMFKTQRHVRDSKILVTSKHAGVYGIMK